MIELNAIIVVLLFEALGGLVLLVLGFIFFSRTKSVNEESAADELINKLEDTEKFKSKKLGTLITESCDINEDELKKILNDISQGERDLYQTIIQIFLNKDIALLKEIDQYIDNLSEPYCKILKYTPSNNSKDNEKLQAAENRMHQLMQENKKLSEQLTLSMSTMDEISAEYSRVFSGSQTELELDNSRKKMMGVFHHAFKQVKTATNNLNLEQL